MAEPIGLVCSKLVSVCYDYRAGVRDAPQDISRIQGEVSSIGRTAQQLIKVTEADKGASLPSLIAINACQDLKTCLKLGKASRFRDYLLWPLKSAEADRKLRAIASIKSTQNMVEILGHTRSLPNVERTVSALVVHSNEFHRGNSDEADEQGWPSQADKQKQLLQKLAPGTGDWLIIKDLKPSCVASKTISALDNLHILKILVSQLINQGARTPSKLLQLLRKPCSRIGNHEKWEQILLQIMKQFPDNFVVFDGLDVCEDLSMSGQLTIIQFAMKLIDSVKGVHLAAFSRSHERLRTLLESPKMTALTQHPRFARWPTSLKQTVESSLLTQVHGLFRWLACQLQTLQRCATSQAARKVLSDLPKSLEEYYRMILASIEVNNLVSVRSLLQWAIFVFRPLNLNKILSAAAMKTDGVHVPYYNKSLELFDLEGFIHGFSSLVLTYCARNRSGSAEVHVKLAHFTVRVFLLSAVVRDKFPGFATEQSLSHSLSKATLVYFQHAARSASESPGALIMGEGIDNTYQLTPLYYAAYYGSTYIVKALLDQGVYPSLSGGLNHCPLQAAARNSHLEIIRILLQLNADVYAEGGARLTALCAAAAAGHVDVAVELLNAGASVEDRSSDPLWLAVVNGHLSMCKVLLSRGARDFFVSKAITKNALDAAVKNNRLEIMLELLKFDPTTGNYLRRLVSSFKTVVEHGHGHILRELLAHGIAGAGLPKEEALAWFPQSGDKDEVRRYLNQGASPNSRRLLYYRRETTLESAEPLLRGADPNLHVEDKTPLEIIIFLQNSDMAWILINVGADTHTNHPLLYVVTSGRRDLIELLLRNGANPYPCLQMAAYKGDDRSFSLLINIGADINKEPLEGLSLLAAAARGSSAPLNGLPEHLPPLLIAAFANNGPVMELLISRGAEVDPSLLRRGANPNKGAKILKRPKSTLPLLLAAEKGNTNILQSLLTAGADLNAQDEEGFTALHYAAACAPGVDLKPKLLNGSLPIYYAASLDTIETLRTKSAGRLCTGQRTAVTGRRSKPFWIGELCRHLCPWMKVLERRWTLRSWPWISRLIFAHMPRRLGQKNRIDRLLQRLVENAAVSP
ncbi:ankyrin repeat-containing domain protein [Aspergillus multicolor]|uniref:ankyrin repeat domain-containing protein n=1 Tax=Aspergillus multicolor TaxID=41759 RepID=UPI003CCDBF8F